MVHEIATMNPSAGQRSPIHGNVLLLAKRFWPFSSDSTHRLRLLCRMLREEGWSVEVLTPRWHPNWPAKVAIEECDVHRLENSPTNQLRQSLYRRSITQWLDERLAQSRDRSEGKSVNSTKDPLSWIWCDEAGLDALTVCNHPQVHQCKIPVVVRFDPFELAENSVDSTWQLSQAVIDACHAAASVVAPNPEAQLQLLRHGVASDKIVLRSDWNVRSIDRSSSAIRQARHALGAINSDLALRQQDRVLIVPGNLTAHWQLDKLIDALDPMLDNHPHLRIILHGEGPIREKLYERLQFLGHHRTVIMPGVFTCLDTLIQTADLCVFPATEIGMSWILPTCLTSGVPVLSARSPSLTWQLGPQADSIAFDANAASMNEAIRRWLRNPDDLAAAVRNIGQRMRSRLNNPVSLVAQFQLHNFKQPQSFSLPRHS